MEDQTSLSTNALPETAESRTHGLAQTIVEQRRQIEEFLASHRDRMDDVETQVTDSLGRIIDELVKKRAEAAGNYQDLEDREARLEEESQRVVQMRAELDAARAEWERSRRAADEQQVEFLEQLRAEIGRIPKGGDIAATDVQSGDDSEGGEFKQRYEMALGDIRELREENKKLKEELDKPRPRGEQSVAGMTAATLSWEAQKQRMLASLDEDFDEENAADAEERAKIEDVIKATESAVAEKNEEIAELKQLLEMQSENIESVTVGAAAFGEMLDSDQIIQEERESLRKIKEELQEKLRRAEIDISVERAKIAREKVELDEKLRLLAQQHSAEGDSESGSADQNKASRGRWLARLGLNDLDK